MALGEGTAIAGYRVTRLLGPGVVGKLAEVQPPQPHKSAVIADILTLPTEAQLPFRALLQGNLEQLGTLHSPHVGSIHGVAHDREHLAVLWDVRGTLPAMEWLQRSEIGLGLLWEQVRPVVDVLHQEHRRGRSHGRIAPWALVSDGETCQLYGFGAGGPGAAMPLDPGALFRPPEYAPSQPPAAAEDVYSLALTLHYLITGTMPWVEGVPPARILALKREGLLRGPSPLPESLVAPLRACLHPDPTARPGMDALRMDLQNSVWSTPDLPVGGRRMRRTAPVSTPARPMPHPPAGASLGLPPSPVVAPPPRPEAPPRPPPREPEPEGHGPDLEQREALARHARTALWTAAALALLGAAVLAWWELYHLPWDRELLDEAMPLLASDLQYGWAVSEVDRAAGWKALCAKEYPLACDWRDRPDGERTDPAWLQERCRDKDALACVGAAWLLGGRGWAPATPDERDEADRLLRSGCRRWRPACVARYRVAWARGEQGKGASKLETWCNDDEAVACTARGDLLGALPSLPADLGAGALYAKACGPDAAGCTGLGDVAASRQESGAEAWTRGCQGGHGAGCLALARSQLAGADANDALLLGNLATACRAGLPEGCQLWAETERSGRLGKPRLDQAAVALDLACALDHAPSCIALRELCGQGVEAACAPAG